MIRIQEQPDHVGGREVIAPGADRDDAVGVRIEGAYEDIHVGRVVGDFRLGRELAGSPLAGPPLLKSGNRLGLPRHGIVGASGHAAPLGSTLCVACQASEREVPKPPAKLAAVRVVDLIPVSLSGESWQDAEPFLALYASNPRLMAASAFTPNPGGSASATAPIFVSDDGGDSWTLRNTLPSQTMTADITQAVGGNPPVLYAGIMKVPDFPLNELKANDLFSPATMILQGFRADLDQPFVRTTAVGNADRVYVGLNDFDASDGRTATVDVSLDGGATYTSRRIETRNTAGQSGRSIRPAVAQDL